MKKLKVNARTVGIIAVVAALLIGAVYLNVQLNGQASSPAPSPSPTHSAGGTDIDTSIQSSAGTNYFADFRTSREQTRNREIEYLNAIINNENTDAETLKDAQKQMTEIVDCMEKEFTIESLLKAKGFTDAAVTFHYGSVNVIVDTATLTNEDVAQILDIVKRETGEEAQNIKVSANS